VTFMDFVALTIIFRQVHALAGWSLGEVAFLYGLTGVAFGLADMLMSQVEVLPDRIRNGTFDRILIRPVSPLLQIVADDFALRRLGKIAQAAIVLVAASSIAHV